jgi:protein-S-isoprenylcysteine O-methyltransferase Ste14
MRTYVVVLLASWFCFCVIWAVTARKAKPSRRRGRFHRARALRFVLALAAFFLARRVEPSLFRVTSGAAAAVGCAVCAGGMAFAAWARLSLGENWGMPMTLREHPELVIRGPYAFVRHPIYTGMTVAIIGTALVVPPYWALVIAFVVYFAYSARREEEDMLAEFPEEYAAYRRRTRWFIPFLF